MLPGCRLAGAMGHAGLCVMPLRRFVGLEWRRFCVALLMEGCLYIIMCSIWPRIIAGVHIASGGSGDGMFTPVTSVGYLPVGP